jgi:hypothetical protein
MSRQILNGWKEISSYINRSVRTVQRWEARLGLPVYRPALKDRSAVMAFSDELDRWISRASPDIGEEDAVLNGSEGNDAVLLQVLDNVSAMVLDTAELSSQVRLLQEQLRQPLELYRHAIEKPCPPCFGARPRHRPRADVSVPAARFCSRSSGHDRPKRKGSRPLPSREGHVKGMTDSTIRQLNTR